MYNFLKNMAEIFVSTINFHRFAQTFVQMLNVDGMNLESNINICFITSNKDICLNIKQSLN
jgi:hypothetical protein